MVSGGYFFFGSSLKQQQTGLGLWGQISTFDICFRTRAIFFCNAASHSSGLANRATPESLRLTGFYYLPTRLSVQPEVPVAAQMSNVDSA